MGNTKRNYTLPELTEIAKILYEAQARERARIYAGVQPVYTEWEYLTPKERDRAIHGLEERIKREGLRGYLERKRPEVGDKLTETIISELKAKGYLPSEDIAAVSDYIKRYSSADLIQMCREARLSTEGSKKDLARRILEHG